MRNIASVSTRNRFLVVQITSVCMHRVRCLWNGCFLLMRCCMHHMPYFLVLGIYYLLHKAHNAPTTNLYSHHLNSSEVWGSIQIVNVCPSLSAVENVSPMGHQKEGEILHVRHDSYFALLRRDPWDSSLEDGMLITDLVWWGSTFRLSTLRTLNLLIRSQPQSTICTQFMRCIIAFESCSV